MYKNDEFYESIGNEETKKDDGFFDEIDLDENEDEDDIDLDDDEYKKYLDEYDKEYPNGRTEEDIENLENADDFDVFEEKKNLIRQDKINRKKTKNEKDNKKKEKKSSKENDNSEEKTSNIKKEVFDWIKSLAIAVAVSLLFLHFFTNVTVTSGSMENTIMTNERLFGYKYAYKNNLPKRGDIIVFRLPDDPEEKYIKRVIGIAGDKIEFTVVQNDQNANIVKVVRNGEILDEDYIREDMTSFEDVGMVFEVPDDCVFVLGDNRNQSFDARYWDEHYVSRDKIIAKAVLRYWPLNKIGVTK